VQIHHIELLLLGVAAEAGAIAAAADGKLASAEQLGASPTNRAAAFLDGGLAAAGAELRNYLGAS